MAQKSGFYNALPLSDGGYDRLYGAEDYNNSLAAFLADGVRRSGEDDLRVNAYSGMQVRVNPGFAMIKGAWYRNTAALAVSLSAAPASGQSRIDRIVLQYNDTISVRDTKIVVLSGTASSSPVAPALTRTESIYEICIAEITVAAGVTKINQTDITDTRPDKTVCGWVRSPVGYDDYFESLDAAFKQWFEQKKDELSSVTLFREYVTRIDTAKTVSTLNVLEYDSEVDIINFYVNGFRLFEDIDYTMNGNTVTFVNLINAGAEAHYVVYKSLDGTGIGGIVSDVETMKTQIAALGGATAQYNYIASGNDDNIKLSELAQAFLDGGDDRAVMTIRIYGKLGITSPIAGSGIASSRYRWFSFGQNASTNRRVIFDFANAGVIDLTAGASTHNVLFYGKDCFVCNASVKLTASGSATWEVFSSVAGRVNAEKCQFEIQADTGSLIAETGTFTDCYGKVVNAGDSVCFRVDATGLLRLMGGEYYAYSGSSANESAVVYIGDGDTQAVAVLTAVNCPTAEVAGLYQNYAVHALTGHAMCYGTITALTISTTNDGLNSGKVNRTKPDRL